MNELRIWRPWAGLWVRFLLWWQFLYLRKNEFHITYSTDIRIMYQLTTYGLQWYYDKLGERRHIAHVRDLQREDRQRDG